MMSESKNCLSFTTLAIIAWLVGCGGGGSSPTTPPDPPPPKADIIVTPAAATITLYSSVDLALTGFVEGTLDTLTWSVERDSSCFDVENPFYPQPSCPDGWFYEYFGPGTVTYYAPVTPGTYHVYAEWSAGGETGQSMATITVTPVNPSVDVTGTWSGTLTETNTGPLPVQYPGTLDLSQDSTGVITGTLTSPVLEAAPCLVGGNTSLSMTAGYVDGANVYVYGSNESEAVVASIQAAVDPSGQQMNGTFSIYQGILDHPVCPAPGGTIVLTKQ
jgi:hypothetical protein